MAVVLQADSMSDTLALSARHAAASELLANQSAAILLWSLSLLMLSRCSARLRYFGRLGSKISNSYAMVQLMVI
jgi:hypothetical protein